MIWVNNVLATCNTFGTSEPPCCLFEVNNCRALNDNSPAAAAAAAAKETKVTAS